MTGEETTVLTRLIKAMCPQQAMDEFTADAWHDLLSDLDFDECRAAMVAIGKRQPFIAPAEIRAEVRRVRDERLARVALPAPPPDATDEPGRYKRIIRSNVQRIADARDIRNALPPGGPVLREPPTEWHEAREAMKPHSQAARTPQEKAREQVEESRLRRQQQGQEPRS